MFYGRKMLRKVCVPIFERCDNHSLYAIQAIVFFGQVN